VDVSFGLDYLGLWREYLVELDDVGVTQYFEDADLPSNSLDIGLLNYLFFLEGLDCDLLSGGDVRGEADFAEGALAYGLACI
jgi:hypothetical protein